MGPFLVLILVLLSADVKRFSGLQYMGFFVFSSNPGNKKSKTSINILNIVKVYIFSFK